jgi:hypothetical protein
MATSGMLGDYVVISLSSDRTVRLSAMSITIGVEGKDGG